MGKWYTQIQDYFTLKVSTLTRMRTKHCLVGQHNKK